MNYRDPKTGRWTASAPTFEPVKIFVYGTLKRGYGLNPMLQSCDFLGEGVTTRRYRMIRVGYPVIMADGDGHPVTGELYLVRDAYTLRRLDQVEGAYDRTPVEVTLRTGAPVSCFIYEGKPRYWTGAFQRENWVKTDEHGELTYEGANRFMDDSEFDYDDQEVGP